MIIGITGKAGAGKDTIADILIRNHGFVKVGLADEIKRICKRVFNFSDDQLWGPSAMRNAPDKRYARPPFDNRSDDPNLSKMRNPGWLTPRHALQQLGTQWARACYENVWVDLALQTAEQLLARDDRSYSGPKGIEFLGAGYGRNKGVVIPDVRFLNEITAIKKAGGKVIRVIRRPQGSSAQTVSDVLWTSHASETEQDEFPTNLIDTNYLNEGTLEDVEREIGEWMAAEKGGSL